jgi:hypothetical protein
VGSQINTEYCMLQSTESGSSAVAVSVQFVVPDAD